jgi:hypothetical protein
MESLSFDKIARLSEESACIYQFFVTQRYMPLKKMVIIYIEKAFEGKE